VRLVMVDDCGVLVRLMTVNNGCRLRYLASVGGWRWRGGCICLKSFGLCGRGCGYCSTSIRLSESFSSRSIGGDRLCDRRIEVRGAG
jgi:hypothetical protein